MVTISDVARHAGASSSTVSYVINGTRPVRRSHIIALVAPLHRGVYVPIMMEIASSVTTAARRHGYDVLLVTNDEGPEGVRRVAASGLAEGVILMDVELDDRRIPALRAQGTQAVLIGLPDDPHGLSCVDHDFTTAGALCADHLADLGHREVAFIGYSSGVYQRHAGYAERTLAGFRTRAGQRGLRFLDRPCEGTYESTAGTLARILADRPGTTGFVVQNEAAVGPLLSLLRADRRSVPEDASVMALCPEHLAEQHAPALTFVSGPTRELGRVAVDQMIRRLTAALSGERPKDEQAVLTPTLTTRQSTTRLSTPEEPS